MLVMCVNAHVGLCRFLCTRTERAQANHPPKRQGVMLIPLGALPTGTVFVTLRSVRSSTETELA